jgi:ribose 5-phosphate isomerase B
MKIAIGCDMAAYNLKARLKQHLDERGVAYEDFGCFAPDHVDYPLTAEVVANAVMSGVYDKGILVCGSGVGMAIAANKVKGIRAVVCSEPYSAKMSIEHNHANVLTMGERVVGPELAVMILDAWLDAEEQAARHVERVGMIKDIEARNFK